MLPTQARCLVLSDPAPNAASNEFYGVSIVSRPIPELKEGDVLVRIAAAGFNRRELWMRQNAYPNTKKDSVLGADGAGIVIAAYDPTDSLLHKRVILVPTRGWESDPRGPETRFGTIGGSGDIGTFTEYVVVHRSQLVLVPAHLPMVYAAAWPIAGLTAWRAITVKARVQPGDNVLITGIGGGVAVTALQICVALGARVFVTSSNPQKIEHAVSLGAIGGVNYADKDWPAQLAEMLRKTAPTPTNTQPAQSSGPESIDLNQTSSQNGGNFIDVIIDSAGADICTRTSRVLLRNGARVVTYGMTTSKKVEFTMIEVLKNIELMGTTLGSRADLINATNFLAEHQILPQVSHVLRGLEEAEQGFQLLANGEQMGKVVIKFPGREPDGSVRE